MLATTALTPARAEPLKSILFVNPLPQYPAWRLIGDCVAKEAEAKGVPATESGPTDETVNTTVMMQQVQQGIANDVGAIVTFPATEGFVPSHSNIAPRQDPGLRRLCRGGLSS